MIPSGRLLKLVFAAILLSTTLTAAAEPLPGIADRWAQEHGGTLWAVGAAPDGTCFAVVTREGVAVLDPTGQPRWSKPHVNRWLATEVGAVAASPGCRWVALAGGSGYRYVWFLNQRGMAYSHAPVSVGSTTALAVNHRGDTLAVGTAAGHLFLMDPKGSMLKDIRFSERLDGLVYSPDDTMLLASGGLLTAGLLSAQGVPLWTRELGAWITITPNNVWTRFLVVGMPGHGSDVGSLELVTREGKTLWEKAVTAPRVEKASDARGFIVSSEDADIDPDDPEERKDSYFPRTFIDDEGHEMRMADRP
ncbi:MAG: hypothetical protein JWQ90_3227 [Hydrocarboniphaga sp.]|uniref:hypothetical protein n=1 Tax=Hydrocarboniphaga sp. TaxID=2033016 RepID=UPI00261A8F74|nr:hypothetical protein [Hydrocarboniphaga sp.]MDB5970777.1 hypothetical protein [Hydrocarboniphaga sp.]